MRDDKQQQQRDNDLKRRVSSMAIAAKSASSSNHGKQKKYTVNGNKYRVLELVGQGAYAEVYKAQDSDGNICALKKYMKAKSTSLESARAEINSLLALKHPNVLKMLDFEMRKGKVFGSSAKMFVVVEYCSDNLVSYIQQYVDMSLPFPEANTIRVLVDISAALCYLHSQKPYLIHRDVKLDNVLIRDNSFVLCDFGSCTNGPIVVTSDNMTDLITEIACYTTPEYRCPEMIKLNDVKEITHKADVWALGCMIYFMCFLKAPFRESMTKILKEEFFIPRCLFSKELLYIMVLALKANPDFRPSSFQLAGLISKISKEPAKVENFADEQELFFPDDISLNHIINKPDGKIPRHRRNISAQTSMMSPAKSLMSSLDTTVFKLPAKNPLTETKSSSPMTKMDNLHGVDLSKSSPDNVALSLMRSRLPGHASPGKGKHDRSESLLNIPERGNTP